MYCPECGTENIDTANFCLDCGTRIKPQPIVLDVKPLRTEKTVYSPHLGSIFIGILIILAMYLIPISSVPYGGTITLAKQVELCSAPFSSLIYRCSNSLSMFFYAGWLVGLFFIGIGIINKKEVS
jgi:hypothetical protein